MTGARSGPAGRYSPLWWKSTMYVIRTPSPAGSPRSPCESPPPPIVAARISQARALIRGRLGTLSTHRALDRKRCLTPILRSLCTRGCVLTDRDLNRDKAAPRSGGRGGASGRSLSLPGFFVVMSATCRPPLRQPRDSRGARAQASASSRAPLPRAGEPVRPSRPAPSRSRRASAGPGPRVRSAARALGGAVRRAS